MSKDNREVTATEVEKLYQQSSFVKAIDALNDAVQQSHEIQLGILETLLDIENTLLKRGGSSHVRQN